MGLELVLIILFLNVHLSFSSQANQIDWKTAASIYEFTAKDIKGNEVSLEKYRGHPVIIVNVASKCGLTASNYADLNKLYEKFSESEGLRILGFPSNQFMSQEPGTESEIQEFCTKSKVEFDLFAKINVNGDEAHPLWKYLKHKQGGTLIDGIKWNFTKFLVDKNGQPIKRYAPTTSPLEIEKDLKPVFSAGKSDL